MKDLRENNGAENYGSIMEELRAVMSVPMRDYKDRVFRMLFREKKRALELYNAMNGTKYMNEEDLMITTLENALYLGMKNDVSFVLYDQLLLYEHQSTKNPNMPLRDLLYVACVYSRLMADKNLYSSSIVKIPEPKFIVFYNGRDSLPEKQELRLSDAFEHPSETPALELKTLVLNINHGCNEELKGRSQTLCDYMIFVDTVRKHTKSRSFPDAMRLAIDECIQNGVLEEFLRENKAEVEKVAIFEYNEEKHMEQERNEAEKRGEERGEERGEKRMSKLITELVNAGRMEELTKAAQDKTVRDALYKEFGI